MNSEFDYLLSSLLVLHKLKHFLIGKQNIQLKKSVLNFERSGIIFSLGDK